MNSPRRKPGGKARDHETTTVADGFVKMGIPSGACTSLEDFEVHYNNIQSANYDWYQLQFGLRGQEIYNQQWFGFLTKGRRAYLEGAPNMSVEETLTRLEAISPGFEAWVRTLSQYKSEVVTPR